MSSEYDRVGSEYAPNCRESAAQCASTTSSGSGMEGPYILRNTVINSSVISASVRNLDTLDINR